jgi:hypothetical protein
MKVFLKAQGYDVWHSFVIGYNATKKPKISSVIKKEKEQQNRNGFYLGRIS